MTVVPVKPVAWPSFGNALTRWFGRTALKLLGWRIIGQLPERNKMIMAVAPHTSNWDFFMGVFALFGIGARLYWIGKHTIFRWPVKSLLLGLGGIPVNRNATQGIVEQLVSRFQKSDYLVLVMTPEGTRKKVKKLKTGFLRIAAEAGVPILLVGFDFAKKQIQIGELFEPTGNIDRDETFIHDYFRQFTGKRPDQY